MGARHLASLGYFYGFFVSAGVYILLSRIFVARQTIVKAERESV
jgi:cytosine/uracil/thiamine/allantoin permease